MAYLDAEVAYVNGKIDDISDLHINRQQSAAWKTINELYGKSLNHQLQSKGVTNNNDWKIGFLTSTTC